MRQKVMAYVVRETPAGRELLVFQHRDFPDAGVQVPAGTVEPGEAVEAAVLREVQEETGLSPAQVTLVRKLAEAHEPHLDQQRHVFHLAPAAALPAHWSHTVRGSGEDAGMVFEVEWVALQPGLTLAGAQERFLHLLEQAP
jgi:ADP-ribose pyrophosphatase YjhB (NUDIX family)